MFFNAARIILASRSRPEGDRLREIPGRLTPRAEGRPRDPVGFQCGAAIRHPGNAMEPTSTAHSVTRIGPSIIHENGVNVSEIGVVGWEVRYRGLDKDADAAIL
jgi:hypothetical protein